MADLRVLKLALLAETKEFIAGLSKAEKESKSFSEKLQGGVKKAALGFAALGAAAGTLAIKFGKDAFRDFQRVEAVLSDIGKATGASGDELQRFGDVARNVGKTVPQSIEEVGSVVGELNTRLGFTGEELEKNTKLFLDYARVNKTDVAASTTLVSKLVNALELDANELERTLGKLTKASQLTGINVDRLTGFILEAGPAFEEFGFGLDESIALFSGFEAAGARPEELLSSLNILMTRLAKQGVTDFRTGFEDLIESIKTADSTTQSVTIAAEAFGARVGAKVAEDIRAGRFEIEALTKAIGDGEGVIADTSAATLTFAEEMEILKNNFALTRSELGQELLPVFRRVNDFIKVELLPRFGQLVDGLTGKKARSVAGATKETNSAFAELGIVIEDNDSAAFLLGEALRELVTRVGLLFRTIDNNTGPGSGLDSFITSLSNAITKIDNLIEKINNAIGGLRRFNEAYGASIFGRFAAGPLGTPLQFDPVTRIARNIAQKNAPLININVRGGVDPQATARATVKTLNTVTTSTGIKVSAPAGFF